MLNLFLIDFMEKSEEVKNWVTEYTDYLVQLAIFKTNDKDMAEDFVQETFLSAIKAVDTFRGDSNPRTWLVTILRNKISDYYREKNRKGMSYSDTPLDSDVESDFNSMNNWKKDSRPVQWDTDSENLLDNSEFMGTLEKCLMNLPSHYERVLRLKYIEETEPDQICQDLGITTSNYWQLLHRAKLKVRKCLERKWFLNN